MRNYEPAMSFDAETAAWMNERLAAVPFAPSLDAASPGEPIAPATYVFCTDTPSAYPCGTTRSRLAEVGAPYTWLATGHDAPLTRPAAVAELVLAAAGDVVSSECAPWPDAGHGTPSPRSLRSPRPASSSSCQSDALAWRAIALLERPPLPPRRRCSAHANSVSKTSLGSIDDWITPSLGF